MPVKTFTPGEFLTAADVNQYLNNGLAPIGAVELVASASFVEFDSIPGDFAHLLLVLNARGTEEVDFRDIFVRFNGDDGANYITQRIRGSATVSALQTGALTSGIISGMPADNAPATGFGGGFALITNYSTSGQRAEWVGVDHMLRATNTTRQHLIGGHWTQTAVVTTVRLMPQSGDFSDGSSFRLYGVR